MAVFITLLFVGPALAQQANPITVENANSGTTDWRLTKTADDIQRQIKGFASATSVNKGEQIALKVSVDTPQTYAIDVYRMGWYDGAGGRLMQRVDALSGTTQAPPRYDEATGMVSYDWETSYVLSVPTTWTSGFYLAKLTNAQGFQNYIGFVVRDDARQADFLYQQPVTTYQAYNAFPRGPQPVTPPPDDPCLAVPEEAPEAPVAVTAAAPFDPDDIGKSLYEFNSSDAQIETGTSRAVQVSFDRPYENEGDGQFFSWEYYTVRWLEREGYDVSYATNLDVHQQGLDLLQRYEGFISVGHDEYYSARMYDAVEGARDAGVDLAYLGSNAVYWQIRFAANAAGSPDRTMVSYKDASLDPVGESQRKTVRWRELGRAEQALLGVQYTSDNEPVCNTPYVVSNSDSFVYEGTGLANGDTIEGVTGYEVDRLFDEFPGPVTANQTLLSASPFSDRSGAETIANASIYQAPSSAWVFASGTMSWAWALDREGFVDSRLQAATRNILRRFLADTSTEPPPSSPDPDPTDETVLVDADFALGRNGFSYRDDAFLGTANASYVDGYRSSTGDATPGSLGIAIGALDSTAVFGVSGGWTVDVRLDATSAAQLTFRYRLVLDPRFEDDEYGEVRVTLDGVPLRDGGRDYVTRVNGAGLEPDTGWRTLDADLGTLGAGWHRVTIGVYNNQRNAQDEWMNLRIDDVRISATLGAVGKR